jgi:hypothetical protein
MLDRTIFSTGTGKKLGIVIFSAQIPWGRDPMIAIARILAVLALTGTIVGCAAGGQLDQGLRGLAAGPTTPLGDGNTNFSVRDRFDGFALTVNYLHPQQGASNQVVLNSCRQMLDVAAVRAAQVRGRFIAPIDNRNVSARTSPSMDFPGFTQCTMSTGLSYTG